MFWTLTITRAHASSIQGKRTKGVISAKFQKAHRHQASKTKHT